MRTGVALGAMLLLGAAAKPPIERVVRGEGVVAGAVNDVPVRWRIDPGATGMPALRPEVAARAGLKPGMFTGMLMVGPVRRVAPTGVAKLTVGGATIKRRVTWPQGAGAGVDATIGPAGLDDKVVRFQLRDARPGERTVALPMSGGGGLFGAGWMPLYARVPLAGGTIDVRFDPRLAHSVVTAGAGQLLATAHDGRFTGTAERMAVVLDVERPVRRMRLARPFVVGPLALGEIHVRTADFGNASGIREEGAVDDPDEVTVVAKGKRDRRNFRLTLGGDQLARCSAIVFDKRAKQVRLTCG